MKQLLLISVAAMLCPAVNAQVTLAPKVIASTGQYVKHGPFEVSYTVGEMAAVTTLGSINGLHITQGFHQPEEVAILTALSEQKSELINVALYPNPTTQTVWIGYHLAEAGKVNLRIYSISGQLIETLSNDNYGGGSILNHYDVSHLSNGNYFMSLQFTSSTGQQSSSSKQFSVTQ